MKKSILAILLISSCLFSTELSSLEERSKVRAEKQLEKEIEREKKFAREQTFYKGVNYDLSDSEVNHESLESVPELKIQDFDMDSVYD